MPVTTHNPVDWSKVKYYKPSNFKHPEKLERSVVYGLDRLAFVIGKPALVLSDWRIDSKFVDSMHPRGRAIDFTYPGIDSAKVLSVIRNQKLISGFGLYVNASGVTSFHVDTRTDRSPENPATWGAQKGLNENEWTYTSLRSIFDKYLTTTVPSFALLLMLGVSIYWFVKKA